MTKRQHFIALLLLLPSLPFALPLSLLVLLTRWAADGTEWLYEAVSVPFLELNRWWAIRCERVNK